MYTATDFNLDNAPKEMVQHVIDNVEDFENRYQRALYAIGNNRCPLRMADYHLYNDIHTEMAIWAIDHNLSDEDFETFDVEEIFG